MLSKKNKPKYQVRVSSKWVTCARADEQYNPRNGEKNGWLHYHLDDGTNGLTKDWRIKPAKGEKSC